MRILSNAIQTRLPEAVSLLQKLISFESTVGNERPLVDFLTAYLKDAGLQVEQVPILKRLENDPEYTPSPGHKGYDSSANLLVRFGGGSGRSVILNSHVDVIPGKPELFTPRVEDGVVYGRGACDAKGQVVTAILALLALKDAGIRLNGEVLLEAVIEEEAGGNGALSFIRQRYKADAAIVMEGTGMGVHPANRGAVWFRLEVKGRSVHMGKYHDGVNAVVEMMGLLDILLRYGERLREESRGHPMFPQEPSPVNVNIGMIQGGEWPAMVAGNCAVEGGIAFLPNKRLADIRDEVRRVIEAEAGEWARANYSLTFDRLHNDAYETPVDHPAVQAFCAAADAVRGPKPPIGFIASCDARLFARVGDMPTITFGPGDLGHAHSDMEQISITQIAQAAEIVARFLRDWCV